jgi:hypothetical protein
VIRALAARHLDLGVLPRRAEASGAASHDGVFLDVKENRRGPRRPLSTGGAVIAALAAGARDF